MKTIYKYLSVAICISTVLTWYGCTKVESGFLSPYIQYAVNEFSIIRGRTSKSYSLITDGSSIPMKVRWVHIYDESGKTVDSLFSKTYPVTIWTAGYNAKTDITYAAITAKQKVTELPPITVNESNGTIEANAGTLNLPLGKYSMDVEVTNEAGTQILPKLMTIYIVEGKSIEISPETGAFSCSMLMAGTASGAGVLFNGPNNPFVEYSITRYADTPNIFTVRVADRNNVAFDPSKGEIAKRPNSGINPNPPFLQNLQDYAPDTFIATDSVMSLKFPLVPFPIQSLGNGYNMYYRIPTAYVQIDSTSGWSNNAAGNFYSGSSDSHYLGVYTNDKFDYALRIPMRIFVPGSYHLSIKLLNTTHR
ncbi:MAG: hypothetical protein IT249_13630 [Chitinophagaceae bacterium]|nr:hypothetical protein [Chitinophagaceae bacterium]